MIFEKEIWLIMSKDRKIIAKGTPRNRALVAVDNSKDRKRILTYNSKKIAENAFRGNWFYKEYGDKYYFDGVYEEYSEEDLEAVRCKMIINADDKI